MDIQAILDESSSEDDEEEFPNNSLTRRNDHHSRQLVERNGSQISDDDDDVIPFSVDKKQMTAFLLDDTSSDAFNAMMHRVEDGPFDDDDDDDDAEWMFESNPISTALNDDTSDKHTSNRNSEDWAVLQAILNEDDEDDNEISDDGNGANDKLNESDSNQSSIDIDEESTTLFTNTSFNGIHSQSYKNTTVDAILDSEDDSDFILDDDKISIGVMSLHGAQNGALLSSTSATNDDIFTVDHRDESFLVEYKELVLGNGINSMDKYPMDEGVDAYFDSSFNQSSIDDVSLKARYKGDSSTIPLIQLAEMHEQNLIKSGHRDIVSPLMVKRKMKPKIELQSKSRTKVNANGERHSMPSSALRLSSSKSSRYNFAGIVESKSIPNICEEIKHNSTVRKKEIGLPTAIAVNSKFIAIGTQRSIIQIFDLFGSVRQQLGKSFGEDGGSVTSIDLSSNGETLIAGYTSGILVWWDTIKGLVLKSITESHQSPITVVRFVNETSVISVDATGLVYKFNFTKSVVWTNYSVDSECLLDGTAGQILAMHVLPSLISLKLSQKEIKTHVSRNLTLIALSSERSSFAVAVEPSVNVLHRWAKPSVCSADDTHHEHSFLPCLAWGWGLTSGGGSHLTPILARSWGSNLQFLHANFPPDDDPSTLVLWPAFGVNDEFETPSPIIALEWLGERTLIYLTNTHEFTVIDTVVMNLIERLDFSGIPLIYAEFSLCSHNPPGKGVKVTNTSALSSTFLNSIRSYDKRLLILCQDEVKSISILGAKRRIAALENEGEWLEALALALDHYESAIKSLEDRKRAEPGDFSYHPEFTSKGNLSEEETWIAALLMRYLKLAIENAPEVYYSNGLSSYSASSFVDLSHSHFQMLAGVCVEFCVVTKRFDLLYGKIFRRFQEVAQISIFFDVLEPYLLNNKLRYIAPEVMAQFVDHHMVSNDAVAVERALLHMDVSIMDFHSILKILRKRKMYSALLYVYTQGLDDFVSPLHILMDAVFDAADVCDIYRIRDSSSPLNPFEKFGSKAILYIQYSLSNKTFPHGDALKENQISSVRAQLLRFLLQEKYSQYSLDESAPTNAATVEGFRSKEYPYLNILLLLDPESTLSTLSMALDAPDAQFEESTYELTTMSEFEVEVGTDDQRVDLSGKHITSKQVDTPLNSLKAPNTESMTNSVLCPDRQLLVGVLNLIISESESQKANNHFLDFMAKYLMKGLVRTPKNLTLKVISRIVISQGSILSEQLKAQDNVIALIEALPPSSYDRNDVLSLVENSSMTRAALILHKMIDFNAIPPTGSKQHLHDFIRTLECYLGDHDEKFRKKLFTFLRKEIVVLRSTKGIHLRTALWEKLPQLIDLDVIECAQTIADLFIDDIDQVLSQLSKDDNAQYKFLRAIISGDLAKHDSVASQSLLSAINTDYQFIYLTLIAKYDPSMVYQYLSSTNDYELEKCLKLCQDYEIADACAYLLERSGNVNSALQLILQTLEERLLSFKKSVRRSGSIDAKSTYKESKPREKSSRQQELDESNLRQMLIAALELCERNSRAESSEHGPQLWFSVLDRLMNARGFLRLSRELPNHSTAVSSVLNDLLQLTMQRMVSNISLRDLVRKITTDHRSSRLNEFREMISSMLQTYSCELDVCSTATDLIHRDMRLMSNEKKRLKSRGSRVRSIMDQSLRTSLNKNVRSHWKFLHSDTCLNISTNGNATIVEGNNRNNENFGDNSETVGDALQRLQSKHIFRLICKNKVYGRARSTINMMPIYDSKFEEGDLSEAVLHSGSRRVGGLSASLNSGRFY